MNLNLQCIHKKNTMPLDELIHYSHTQNKLNGFFYIGKILDTYHPDKAVDLKMKKKKFVVILN